MLTASKQEQVTFRLPRDLSNRADRLLEEVAVRPEGQIRRLSKSYVMRLAVLRGLESLEKELGIGC